MTRYAILFLISLAVFAGWENIQINDNDAGSMTGRVMYFGADYEAAVDDDYQWDDSGKILTVTGTVSATTISVSDDAYDAAWNASSDVPTKNAVYDKIESLGGGGDVSKVGTPVDGQIGVWTGDGTIEGDGSLTFDTTDDTFAIAAGGNLAFGAFDIIADVAGTTNLKNIDGIDTTTKNTIQTAIDSLGTVSATTISVSDDAYAAGWNGSTDVPTKNALYDKIEETVEYSRETSAGTGLVDGGILTIGTGGAGVATTFSISDGYGYVLDTSTPGSPTLTKVSWTGKTDISVTNIATQLITFVCINSAGTVVQSASEWGPSEYRSCIIIGVVVHVNNTTVDAVNNRQVPVNHLHSNVADLFEAVGFINLSGNTLSGNPDVSLNIQKSAGVLFGHGINYANNVDDPNQLTLAARGTGAGDKSTFQYRLSDGTYGTGGDAPYASLTNEAVHPTRYESATGVLSTVSPNKWTVQRVYGFTSNNIKVQYGTAEYATSSEAQAAISTEAFVTEPSIEANGILWGYIVIDEGCASLTDASTVVFIPAGKFGSSGGGGGGGTTDHGALTGLGDDDHTQYILHTELDTEAELESALTDVSNVYTNNDATGTDATVVTGTAGTSGNLVQWDANGDAVDSSVVAADVKTTRTGVWRSFWIGAGAWDPDATTGPQVTTTSDGHTVLAFDGASSETARFVFAMPYTWIAGSAKIVEFHWLAATGASPGDGVAWEISMAGAGDNDVFPPTTGTAVQTTDTVHAVGDAHKVKSLSITISTVAVGELVEIELFRDHDDAGDTMTEDALLLGVLFLYQESSTEPSTP
jgi:hypothetical protein